MTARSMELLSQVNALLDRLDTHIHQLTKEESVMMALHTLQTDLNDADEFLYSCLRGVNTDIAEAIAEVYTKSDFGDALQTPPSTVDSVREELLELSRSDDAVTLETTKKQTELLCLQQRIHCDERLLDMVTDPAFKKALQVLEGAYPQELYTILFEPDFNRVQDVVDNCSHVAEKPIVSITDAEKARQLFKEHPVVYHSLRHYGNENALIMDRIKFVECQVFRNSDYRHAHWDATDIEHLCEVLDEHVRLGLVQHQPPRPYVELLAFQFRYLEEPNLSLGEALNKCKMMTNARLSHPCQYADLLNSVEHFCKDPVVSAEDSCFDMFLKDKVLLPPSSYIISDTTLQSMLLVLEAFPHTYDALLHLNEDGPITTAETLISLMTRLNSLLSCFGDDVRMFLSSVDVLRTSEAEQDDLYKKLIDLKTQMIRGYEEDFPGAPKINVSMSTLADDGTSDVHIRIPNILTQDNVRESWDAAVSVYDAFTSERHDAE
jgi:hypothetical protein